MLYINVNFTANTIIFHFRTHETPNSVGDILKDFNKLTITSSERTTLVVFRQKLFEKIDEGNTSPGHCEHVTKKWNFSLAER